MKITFKKYYALHYNCSIKKQIIWKKSHWKRKLKKKIKRVSFINFLKYTSYSLKIIIIIKKKETFVKRKLNHQKT